MSGINTLKVGIAQFSSAWLDKESSINKINTVLSDSSGKADIIAFPEAFLPGYPFWLNFTNASSFNSELQKSIFSHYFDNAICIENGDLDSICSTCTKHKTSIILGIVERPKDRGGHSLYCSAVYINEQGIILNVHRKLVPTYEERLVWANGDGHGLKVFPKGKFNVSMLNCWENWMPNTRTSLYAMGSDLHFALWPGSVQNTQDITRFMAKESRSFVISVSSVLRKVDIPKSLPFYTDIIKNSPDILADGGSCISAPDGTWVLEPQKFEEKLIIIELDHSNVRKERQNFDPSGHYSRPDIFSLSVNTKRQGIISEK
jgi:nitrilase